MSMLLSPSIEQTAAGERVVAPDANG